VQVTKTMTKTKTKTKTTTQITTTKNISFNDNKNRTSKCYPNFENTFSRRMAIDVEVTVKKIQIMMLIRKQID